MDALLFYIPLGVIGLIRWISWLVRRTVASFYRPVRNGFRLPLTVVVPVYQEEPELFRTAIRSWLANDVDEIICVIDETDTTSLSVASQFPIQVIVTPVPGKRDALRLGWEAAETPLVALTDSDTVWAPDVARRACEPFADPEVGGVATRQNVLDEGTFWQRANDIYLDGRYFEEAASQTVAGQAVSVLSGRTAVYRRELLEEVSDEFMNETFWGVACNSGDDKRLTSLLLERGHKTVLQRTARVWSAFPPDGRTFVMQRLRWSRNTWRSDLRALTSPWVRDHGFLMYTMIDKAVSSFTLLLAPTFLVIGIIRGDWAFVLALVLWWLVSRAVKMLPHLRRRPRDLLILPPFILLTFFMALVKISALLTIRMQRWHTRDVAVVGGEVRRTTANRAA